MVSTPCGLPFKLTVHLGLSQHGAASSWWSMPSPGTTLRLFSSSPIKLFFLSAAPSSSFPSSTSSSYLFFHQLICLCFRTTIPLLSSPTTSQPSQWPLSALPPAPLPPWAPRSLALLFAPLSPAPLLSAPSPVCFCVVAQIPDLIGCCQAVGFTTRVSMGETEPNLTDPRRQCYSHAGSQAPAGVQDPEHHHPPGFPAPCLLFRDCSGHG